MSTDRLPPHSDDAERGVLGCIILDASVTLPTITREIGPEHFYTLAHRTIFMTLLEMRREEVPIDTLTLTQRLKDSGNLDGCGGMGFICGLPDHVPWAGNFGHYVEIVREKFHLRSAAQVFAETERDLTERPDRAKTILAVAGDALHALSSGLSARATKREWFRFYSPSECRDYDPPQGLVLVGDCHVTRGAVTVIAGPPGVGKSRSAHALAVAGATGHDWFGLKIHRRFRTAILQNENGLYRLKLEFKEIGAGGLDEFIRISEPPPFGMAFDKPDFRLALSEWLDTWKPELVIFDPWNSAARDDAQRDYFTLFQTLKDILPKGDAMPALVIVAHTRKPKGDERKTGRGLLNDVAGSHVLVSVPRAVFALQAASDSPEDDRVVWTCCKNNDGELGNRTAWHRRNGLFVPCNDLDWDAFDKPEGDGRRTINKADLDALFTNGKRRLELKYAAKELEGLTGLGRSACYDALKLKGRFEKHLGEDANGLLSWKP